MICRISALAVVLLLAPVRAPAQTDDSPAARSATEEKKAFSNEDEFGGPKTVGAQLERDNTARKYRQSVRVFADWFEHKRRVNDDYGIQYNLNYVTVGSWASESSAAQNDKFAASGIATALAFLDDLAGD